MANQVTEVNYEAIEVEILSELHNFLREKGLFDDGVDIGRDKHKLTHVIVYENKQESIMEEFLNELEEKIVPNGYRMDDFAVIVYSDEYARCDNCSTIVRTSPDSYSWTPEFWLSEEGVECNECMHENPAYYLEYLINDSKKANQLLTHDELIEHGFSKLPEGYQNGLFDGMNDNPAEILKKLDGQYDDVIFNVSEVSQFYVSFDVYVRNENEE